MKNIYSEINRLLEKGEKAALCIVTGTKGSTPRKSGSKMIVRSDGSIFGSVGGGNLEKEVIKNALEQIKKNEGKSYHHNLLHEHDMCCGGSMDVYIEPLMSIRKLYIFGAGHTGEALAKVMSTMDFDVYVIDDRAEYVDAIQIEGINKMNVDFKKVLPTLPFDHNTFVVILTYSHPKDREILAYCLKKPFAYMGMIGSKRKVEMTKKNFNVAGIATQKELAKVDMPMGLDIGAESPQEIAVSIGGRIIEVKNKVLS